MHDREAAVRIFADAVAAVRPEQLIRSACRLEGERLVIFDTEYDLSTYSAIRVFGSGKAAWTMAHTLEGLLGERVDSGLIVGPVDLGALQRIEVMTGSHPVPDRSSLDAAEALKAAVAACEPDELVLYLLSGGSSALIESPIAPITLEELQETTRALLHHQLDIGEINTVRKHISSVKGGRLGSLCRATCAVLVISDVIGDDLEVIGSAPMYLDRSSFADARGILQARAIWTQIPEAVRGVIESGCTGRIPESPKAAAKQIRHFLVGSNGIALQAAADRAEALGYEAVIARQMISGDADATGQELVALARSVVRTERSRCYCFGGETTVLVTGDGRGGRNQQLCLSALSVMGPDDDFTLLSAGTDGIDGNSDAAGAVIDPATCDRVVALKLDIKEALGRNDATGFFEQSGNLIVTGPSGTNVMDVVILIIPAKGT